MDFEFHNPTSYKNNTSCIYPLTKTEVPIEKDVVLKM